MTRTAETTTDTPGDQRVDDRYQIHELLGRGGMACVYRVTDRTTGRELALKQLVAADGPAQAVVGALFEREFQTLVQLRHPRVIAVYDYGVDASSGPYYTMELLDGGDLRERAPVPWRELCGLVFDVCSSLALLHSRRLLHRDISPRNIRCTREGKAKLIDFGAMAPMTAGGATVVGTPAFTPPETLHRLALDGRADLYSLGATLYYALTGQLPYPARTFADVIAAWKLKVVPPSVLMPGIPSALDDLVLSLISVEATLRPQSAFDVMQRLAAIAQLERTESEAVSRAYLATPVLVGRDVVLSELRAKLLATRMAHGAGLWIDGAAGVGRSRLLDACVLEAKTIGLTVLRATASGAREPFAMAHGLTKHLLDALPSLAAAADFPLLFNAAANDNLAPLALRNFADPSLDPEQLQQAICRFLLSVSRSHPLLIAVDDVQRIDQPSAAVLAALIDRTHRGSLCVALTADDATDANEVVTVLSRRCERWRLEPLTRDQTHQLFGSLFGDVANLDMLAAEIYGVSLGNPRQCMDTAQHLVDRGSIRYAAGTWTLPNRLSADDLPGSAVDATRARIATLSQQARFLAEAQALAYYEVFSDADYRALLPEASSHDVERALSELLAIGALVSDGSTYALANRVWTAAFGAALDADELKRRHAALGTMYMPKSAIGATHHAFASGDDVAGLDLLVGRQADYITTKLDHRAVLQQNVGKMVWCYAPAIETALRLGRSPRQVSELRRWHFAGTIVVENLGHCASAPAWFEQLARDSGLALWRADSATVDPGARLTRALQGAHERYLATPEHERVYSVDEAIRRLAEYVVYSIAISVRLNDVALTASLPAILEPFAPLSPVLDAVWNNAIAAHSSQCRCQYEFARERWVDALAKLDALRGGEIQHIEAISNAIAFAIGSMEAQLGMASATNWAARLDTDPFQKVSALHLRRIVRLEQGDWDGADQLRRQAEVMSLQMQAPQMFKSLLSVELAACTKAGDLSGIQLVLEQLKQVAARFEGWQPSAILAEACFHLVRGDYVTAREGFERCIALTNFDADGNSPSLAIWIAAQAGLAEALLGTEHVAEARASAALALQACEARAIVSAASELVRTLALAEAKLGEAGAAARLEALIAQQTQLGATGLRLGLSYEARTQIAIWSGDAAAFEHYARLTAREYRYGARSPLGARYERLMNEAGRHGLREGLGLGDLEVSNNADSDALGDADVQRFVSRTMLGTLRIEDRAHTALQLICESRNASDGHLYLTSAQGLLLGASFGAQPAPASLAAIVKDYLVREEDRADTMTVMATSAMVDAPDGSATVQIADVSYELLLLTCVIDGVGKTAGVAAVSGEGRARNLKQAQLLRVLATHLIQSSEPGSGVLA